MDREQLKDRLKEAADEITKFLASVQMPDGGFPGEPFYGPAYAVALWKSYPNYLEKYHHNYLAGLRWCNALAHDGRHGEDTHYEFMNYGVLRAHRQRYEKDRNNDRVVNWQLLRLLTQVLSGQNYHELDKSLIYRVTQRQFTDGLLPDFFEETPDEVPSHQYHNFSTCLCGELAEAGLERWDQVFFRGINYIERIATPGGDVNYMGRGNRQLKGYAVAVHALVQHDHLRIANDIMGFVMRHKRTDEPFPLVLGGHEPRYSHIPPGAERPDGWESYNRYFDYLALAGYYFKRALDTLEKRYGATEDS